MLQPSEGRNVKVDELGPTKSRDTSAPDTQRSHEFTSTGRNIDTIHFVDINELDRCRDTT